MVPKIREAWETYGQGWEGARVYKVASMLCAVDPTVFELLDYHELHADIEYYYVINCKDTEHIGTKPVWTLTVYGADFNFEGKLKDEERLSKLAEGKINELRAEEIEPE